jgi:hypothetical protein
VHSSDASVDGLKSVQQRRSAKVGQRIAALVVLQMLGSGIHGAGARF